MNRIDPSEEVKCEIAIHMDEGEVMSAIDKLKNNIDWLPTLVQRCKMVLKIYRSIGGERQFEFEKLLEQ